MSQIPFTLDSLEQCLKVIALLGDGGFFAWKLYTGWLIINLKLSLRLDRASKTSDTDYLGITVMLKQGNTYSI